MTVEEVAKAAELACLVEVMAPKPGNVNRQYDFTDTTYEDFILSAWASSSPLARAGELSVGRLVLEAGRATRQVAAGNTNLGILLLLAPLVKAAVGPGDKPLRENLTEVLASLTVADTRAVYTAIREAKAGGMGKVPEQDVAEEPTLSLRETMELAQKRDSIAAEYSSGYHFTFTIGLPALRQARINHRRWMMAVVEAFLVLLAQVPDTLIARKAGWAAAQEVSRCAQGVLAAGGLTTAAGRAELEGLDNQLRREGNRLNPGTTADLLVASLFVLFMEEGCYHFFSRKG